MFINYKKQYISSNFKHDTWTKCKTIYYYTTYPNTSLYNIGGTIILCILFEFKYYKLNCSIPKSYLQMFRLSVPFMYMCNCTCYYTVSIYTVYYTYLILGESKR